MNKVSSGVSMPKRSASVDHVVVRVNSLAAAHADKIDRLYEIRNRELRDLQEKHAKIVAQVSVTAGQRALRLLRAEWPESVRVLTEFQRRLQISGGVPANVRRIRGFRTTVLQDMVVAGLLRHYNASSFATGELGDAVIGVLGAESQKS